MRKFRLPPIVRGGIITSLVLVLFFILGLLILIPPSTENMSISTANILVLEAPTQTWTLIIEDQTITPQEAIPSDLSIGLYVQVVGTEGEGLRIRSSPSLSSETLFVAMEDEAFRVADGPQVADGKTWWYLTAPYDQTRSGWAASDYLISLTTQLP